jgi:hypothetical protein
LLRWARRYTRFDRTEFIEEPPRCLNGNPPCPCLKPYIKSDHFKEADTRHRCPDSLHNDTSWVLCSVALCSAASSFLCRSAGPPMQSHSQPKQLRVAWMCFSARNLDHRFAPKNTFLSAPVWLMAPSRLIRRDALLVRMRTLSATYWINASECLVGNLSRHRGE